MTDQVKDLILLDDEYYRCLIDEIDKAKYSIYIEMYIFNNDLIGNKIATHLISAAKRNVTIKIIVDGIGSPYWGDEMTQRMECASIKTKIYHPVPWRIHHWQKSTKIITSILQQLTYLIANINKRNHRKLCIIDNNIVIIGSSNISMCHIKKDNGGSGWHDINVIYTGVETSDLMHSFENTWGTVSIKKLLMNTLKIKISESLFKLNDTLNQRLFYYKKLSSELYRCKNRIWIMNAYFIPDQNILKLLIKAAKRNVDVRIILPYQSDILIVSLVSKTFYNVLIESGVRIYEYIPNVLHAKALVIDDEVHIGSSNIDYRSIKHNLEVDARLHTDSSKNKIIETFKIDFEKSKLFTSEQITEQSVITRILGYILLFIRYWL